MMCKSRFRRALTGALTVSLIALLCALSELLTSAWNGISPSNHPRNQAEDWFWVMVAVASAAVAAGSGVLLYRRTARERGLKR